MLNRHCLYIITLGAMYIYKRSNAFCKWLCKKCLSPYASGGNVIAKRANFHRELVRTPKVIKRWNGWLVAVM